MFRKHLKDVLKVFHNSNGQLDATIYAKQNTA